MNKAKLFLSNFIIYGLCGVLPKLIAFVMVPIMTNLMPDTSCYGISDMANTLESVASSVAVLGMYDAMYRLFFDDRDIEYQKKICSTTLFFTISLSVAVAIAMVVFRRFLSVRFFKDGQYTRLVLLTIISTVIGSTNSIVSAPTRMQNQRGRYLVIQFLSSFVAYPIAIYLLIQGYYTTALIVSGIFTRAFLELTYFIVNRKWFRFGYIDFKLLKPLLSIALPIFPVFIVYWVFNSCDRLMITSSLGLGESGIYAVGAKLGSISGIVHMAFSGGWQFFAFSTMNEKEQVKNNSLMFEYLGIVSFIGTMFICSIAYPFYKLLFKPEYLKGYIVSPYLFLAPLILMLYQVLNSQFVIIKKTWPNLLIVSFGAVFNVVFNWLLIPIIGIEGAAISTLAGYLVTVIICTIVLYKMKLFVFSGRFLVSCAILIVYFISWRLLFTQRIVISFPLAIVGSAFMVLLYLGDIKRLFKRKATE